MASYRSSSWLLGRHYPGWEKGKPGDLSLWWGVIHQACHDLRYGHRQVGLDALDFLTGTGHWLVVELYGIDPHEYKMEVTRLLMERNRYGEPLCES